MHPYRRSYMWTIYINNATTIYIDMNCEHKLRWKTQTSLWVLIITVIQSPTLLYVSNKQYASKLHNSVNVMHKLKT